MSDVLVHKEDTLSPRATVSISLHDNLQLLPDHSGFLVSMDQRERRGITFMAGIMDSDHQKAIGFLSMPWEQKENTCGTQVIHTGIC